MSTEKIEAAAEAMAESEERQAEAAESVAEAVTEQKTTEAAQVAVATAGAAAALATETAAMAEVKAAEVIQEKEQDLAWLKQHAAQTENSFQELNSRITGVESVVNPLMGELQKLSGMMASLTPQSSVRKTEEVEIIQPAAEAAKEGGPGGQTSKGRESQNSKAEAKRKAKIWA